MTGENTLPVLIAAHIRPFAEEGPHLASNGLLLRSDIHTLFDRGLLCVTPELRIEVSSRIRTDFGNGKHYYALHGQPLQTIPAGSDRPRPRIYRVALESRLQAVTNFQTE